MEALISDDKPAYVRVGRNPVEDVYEEEHCPFVMDQATVLCEGKDVLIVACGEMVKPAAKAAKALADMGIQAAVLDMYCLKPFDQDTLLKLSSAVKGVITVEEHGPFGGLGSMVCQIIGSHCPKTVFQMALPDAPVITGTSQEVFDYYGLNTDGIVKNAVKLLGLESQGK